MKALFNKLFGRMIKTKGSLCGHETALRGTVEVFGKTLTLKNQDPPQHCLQCLADMSIRCAWCREPILVGDPITLYTPRPTYEIPDHAVYYSDNPVQLVGCLRWDCADSGASRAGFWLPSETEAGVAVVQRVLSPLEQCMMGGGTVIVNDASNVAEAVNNTTAFIKEYNEKMEIVWRKRAEELVDSMLPGE